MLVLCQLYKLNWFIVFQKNRTETDIQYSIFNLDKLEIFTVLQIFVVAWAQPMSKQVFARC